jgi:ribonuclease Z
VHHCHDAFGLILILANGQKLVYSGDTRPCERLIAEGRGCDLLIHEATFEDRMQEDAIQKNHSTVGEALDVGYRMQARMIMLTHFSQRYPTLPPQPSKMAFSHKYVGFAFDGMELPLTPYHQEPLAAFMQALHQGNHR